MKKNILDRFLDKTLSRKDAAKLLNMAPTAFSRLKRGYVEQGVNFLVPKKPGPKANSPPTNKTPKVIEDLVVNLAYDNRFLGPEPLAEKLSDEYDIVIDSVTVWRILKRRHVRYGQEYIKIPKAKPQLYSLDEPGIEVQMDGCYPFGRSRKIICFDAVDDCSRHAFSKIYYGTENTEIAIRFVNELVARSPYDIQTIKIDNKLGKRFEAHCESLGIKVVRIDPYQPQQNGKVERYHRTLNEMLFWSVLSIHDDVETLNYKLTLWLAYYNRQRRHGGYGMNRMTPNAKIASILAKNLTNNYFGCSYPQNVTGTMQQYNY